MRKTGFILALLSYFVSGLTLARWSNQQNNWEYRDNATEKQLTSCVKGSFPTCMNFKRPPQNPNPNREEWRQEQDLQAQSGMAEYTYWIMVASVVGIAIGVGGLFMIWHTLIATRDTLKQTQKAADAAWETVKETTRIGERQTRGYLDVRKATILISDSSKQPTVRLDIFNSGQTPCYQVIIFSGIKFDQKGFSDPIQKLERFTYDRLTELFGNDNFVATVPNGCETEVVAKYTQWPHQEAASQFIRDGQAMHYFGEIHYIDVFNQGWIQDYYFIFRSSEAEQNVAANTKPKKSDKWHPV